MDSAGSGTHLPRRWGRIGPLQSSEEIMFVVLGATGNTGKVVAETLLTEKKAVRLVVRDPAKVASFQERGAEVVTGDVETGAGLAEALRGAEAAFLLIPPPSFTATGVLASRARIVDNLVAAVKASGIKRVVLLSSVGAQHATGTGIIGSLHHAETRFRELGIDVTFVRAGYFMENLLGVLHPVQADGVLPAFFEPTKKIPMVATHDIGVTAAHALLAAHPSHHVIELGGPEDYSLVDAAATFGKLLGKTVNVFPVPPEAQVGALQQAGFGQEMAELFVGLDRGVDDGKVAWEGGGAQRAHGKIGLGRFLDGVLASAAK
jgi:uncharacterized protein YbjT (DUF2867 family)